jgi:hypothetical protein
MHLPPDQFGPDPCPDSPTLADACLPPGQFWFSPREVAELLGCSDQFVRNHFDSQEIFGHTLCSVKGRRPVRKRCLRIPRSAVQLYFLESANYAPADFEARVLDLLRYTPERLRKRLLTQLGLSSSNPARALSRRA